MDKKIIRYRHEYSDVAGTPYPWKNDKITNFTTNHLDGQYDKNDIAMGDRFGNWEQLYHIGRLLEWKWTIQCMRSQFPESYFFDFPQTEFISDEEFYSNIDDYKCLNNIEFRRLAKGKFIPSHPYLFLNHRSIQCSYLGENPISLIRLVYPEMEKDLRELFSDYIAVHVRRYHGIRYDDNDLIELSPELKAQYKREARYNPSWSWKYVKDRDYFEYMKKINPNQKFYIATDLDEKYYLNQWKEQFPNRIFNMKDILSQFVDILSNYYGKDSVRENYRFIYQMTDFFALAYSGQIIAGYHRKGSGPSSFALTAHWFGKTKLSAFITHD